MTALVIPELSDRVDDLERQLRELRETPEDTIGSTNDFFIDNTGKVEGPKESNAPNSFRETFTDNSWEGRYLFPSVSPIGKTELVEGGGLKFKENVEGWVDFIYPGYRSERGIPSYLSGRQLLNVDKYVRANMYWAVYHRFLGTSVPASQVNASFVATRFEVGTNLVFMIKRLGNVGVNENQPVEAAVSEAALWLASTYAPSVWEARVWDADPNRAINVGTAPRGWQGGSFAGGGQTAAGTKSQDRFSAVFEPTTAGGDPGFGVANPRAGSIIYSWEINPYLVIV